MNRNKDKREDEIMEVINKPQASMMIAQGMTKAFIDMLSSEKCSETYWNECMSTKKVISSSCMDKLKEMCSEEE